MPVISRLMLRRAAKLPPGYKIRGPKPPKTIKWLWSPKTGPILFRYKTPAQETALHWEVALKNDLPTSGRAFDRMPRGTAELNDYRNVIQITSYYGGEDTHALEQEIKEEFNLPKWKMEYSRLHNYDDFDEAGGYYRTASKSCIACECGDCFAHTAALPDIKLDAAAIRSQMEKVKAKVESDRGYLTDQQLANFLEEALGVIVDIKGTPVEPQIIMGQLHCNLSCLVSGSGASYSPNTDSIAMNMRPGGATMVTLAKNLKNWNRVWNRFVSAVVSILTHERTHGNQFNRMKEKKQDKYDEHITQFLKSYKGYNPQDPTYLTNYLSNQVEIGAYARQAVQDLRSEGYEDREIYDMLRDRSLWASIGGISRAFSMYLENASRSTDARFKRVFRKFLMNMSRALNPKTATVREVPPQRFASRMMYRRAANIPNEEVIYKTTKGMGSTPKYFIRAYLKEEPPFSDLQIGFIILNPDGDNFYIENVSVDKGFQRYGVGYDLYKKAIELAKKKGAERFCQGVPREPVAGFVWNKLKSEYPVMKDPEFNTDYIPLKTASVNWTKQERNQYPITTMKVSDLKLHPVWSKNLSSEESLEKIGRFAQAIIAGNAMAAITIKPDKESGKYVITDGQHRYKAALQLGITEVATQPSPLSKKADTSVAPVPRVHKKVILDSTGPITRDGWLFPDDKFRPNGNWDTHIDAAMKLGFFGYQDAYNHGMVRVSVGYTGFMETIQPMNDKLDDLLIRAAKRMTNVSEIKAWTGDGETFEKYDWDGKQFNLQRSRLMASRKFKKPIYPRIGKDEPITEDGWLLPDGTFQPNGRWTHRDSCQLQMGMDSYTDAWNAGCVRVSMDNPTKGFLETTQPMNNELDALLEDAARRMQNINPLIYAWVGTGDTFGKYQWDGKQFERFADRRVA